MVSAAYGQGLIQGGRMRGMYPSTEAIFKNVFDVVYINVCCRKRFFGGKQLSVLPPWLQPICDVPKASLL